MKADVVGAERTRLKALFHHALEVSQEERSDWLGEVRETDPSLHGPLRLLTRAGTVELRSPGREIDAFRMRRQFRKVLRIFLETTFASSNPPDPASESGLRGVIPRCGRGAETLPTDEEFTVVDADNDRPSMSQFIFYSSVKTGKENGTSQYKRS